MIDTFSPSCLLSSGPPIHPSSYPPAIPTHLPTHLPPTHPSTHPTSHHPSIHPTYLLTHLSSHPPTHPIRECPQLQCAEKPGPLRGSRTEGCAGRQNTD